MMRELVLFFFIATLSWAHPVRFESNAGQFPADTRFASRGARGLFALGEHGVTFGSRQGVVSLSFPGSLASTPEGERQAGVANYLTGGDPAAWRTGVAAFSQVRYRSLYRGIDLIFHAAGEEIEYDFAVAPNADPGAIRIRTSARASLNAQGDLVLGPGLRQHRPVLYQVSQGRRLAVAGGYRLLSAHLVSFTVGSYDHRLPLIIDPVISTSVDLGGSSVDRATAIALDAAGNVYLAGSTTSGDFPTGGTPFQTKHGGQPGNAFGIFGPAPMPDAFVMKIDPSGSIRYSTYLGGASSDEAYGIAVDAAGNAYVTGWTTSDNFPSVSGSFVHDVAGTGRAFAVKLSADGSKLLYSARLGGRNTSQGLAVALDSTNRLVVCGNTSASDFPATPGAYRTSLMGPQDAFVARLNADGTALDFATFFGGAGADSCSAVALDAAGAIAFAGTTNSTDLPVGSEAPQRALKGDMDGFVARLTNNGASLAASTYLGGSGSDSIASLTLMPDGGAAVAGQTSSMDFPSAPVLHGSTDAFVVRLSAIGDRIVFTTLLGGSDSQMATGIAVDSNGNLAVSGMTNSVNFPVSFDAFPEPFVGSPGLVTGITPFGIPPGVFTAQHAFLTRLNGTTGSQQFSTYLGGSGTDRALAVATDAAGSIWVTGFTSSFNFPTSTALTQPTYHADTCTTSFSPSSVDRYACGDAFLTRVAFFAVDPNPNAIRIVNNFSGVEGPIAPGEIINIAGKGIGPQVAEGVELDAQGRVTKVRQNTRVLFDGTPAPIISVAPDLITLVVPYDVSTHFVSKITVERTGGPAPVPLFAAVTIAQPALIVFGPGTQIAALNQDGTLNDVNHKAKQGSIVSLYVTGMGAYLPPLADGTVVQTDSLPKPASTVNVVFGHYAGDVLYAGGAPFLVNGVLQVNVRIPNVGASDLHGSAVPVWVFSGFAVSPAKATIAIE